MSEQIKVFIADDDELSREGMRRFVETAGDMAIVGEAGAINDAVWQVQKLRPDILLLDMKWFSDEEAGLPAIRRLRVEAPETKIIAITAVERLVGPAREAGAHGAVTKHIRRRELLEEIRSIHALPSQPISPKRDEKLDPLSERELEVLALMAQGLSDKTIGARLIIAENTVKGHVRSIISKLQVENRTAAVTKAYRLRLLASP